ncbi:hypothetical protein GDO81_001825, partial [Engystomops pustulosus]
ITNITKVSYFILQGFPFSPVVCDTIFVVLLLIYFATLAGNFLMIIIIWTDYRLHSPMYFFLRNLSLLETFGISAIIPQLLFVLRGNKLVSLGGCYTQCYIYFVISSSCFLLLSAMSVDRYLAICSPLRYPTIMTHNLCVTLVGICVMIPFVLNSCNAVGFIKLPLCGYIIDHFFCDSTAILKLVCVDITFFILSGIISSIFILVIPLIITVISYIFIVYKIVMIPSVKGRQKTFSTCVSHLTMVSIVFGSAIFIQIRPSKSYSIETDKIINLVSTDLAPLLNPFIYTLRNQQVKDSIKDAVKSKK